MLAPEIVFTDPCLNRATQELGGLVDKLDAAANDAAHKQFGETFIPNPSDIELTPMLVDTQSLTIMRMWHQTSGPRPAVFQRHDIALSVELIGEDAHLTAKSQDSYPLTTRETLLLQHIAVHAVAHAVHALGPDRD